MRKLLYAVAILLVLAFVGTVCLAVYTWDYFQGAGPLQQETTVILEPGSGFNIIADKLTQAGVIDKPLLFKGMVLVLGEGRHFKAGEYLFKPAATPRNVMRQIADGKVVIHKITVPEGYKVADVISVLDQEPLLTGSIEPMPAEGSLLPETYHFKRGESKAEVIGRMQQGMQKLLDELWQKRRSDLPLKSPQEALTLASIVEKETGVANERGHVASVFINRLRLGMKLQSDPTVVYGMELVMGAPLGRPLLSEDLKTPTPYNTYVIDALPPGPIANPGKAALEAVMNPPVTEDLYFVATGKGGHHFASSLDQHNKNVAAYRRLLREQ